MAGPRRAVAFANSLPGIVLFNLVSFFVPLLPLGRIAVRRSARGVGLSISAAGLLLGLVSLRRLGPNYSRPVLIKPGQELVTRGPYSRTRHPLYTANFIMYFGFCLAMGSIPGLVILAVLFVPRFVAVAKYEEELLEEEFGDDYRDWAGRTGRFLPR